MVNDHLSDLVSRIKNGYMAGREMVEMPESKLAASVAKVLLKEGYLADVRSEEKLLILKLKYAGKKPVITDIKRVSKPGARVYTPVKDLPRVLGGLGINILSTPKGVVSGREAKKLNSGGELLIQVW